MRKLLHIFGILSLSITSNAQIVDVFWNGKILDNQSYLMPDTSFCSMFEFNVDNQINFNEPLKGRFGVIRINSNDFAAKIKEFKHVEALTLLIETNDLSTLKDVSKCVTMMNNLRSLKIVELNTFNQSFVSMFLNGKSQIKALEICYIDNSLQIQSFPPLLKSNNYSLLKLVIHSDSVFSLNSNLEKLINVEELLLITKSNSPLMGIENVSSLNKLKKLSLLHDIPGRKVIYQEFPFKTQTKHAFLFYFSESSVLFQNVPNGIGRFIYNPEQATYSGYSYLPIDCSNLKELGELQFLRDSAASNLVLKNVSSCINISKLNDYSHIKYVSIDHINLDSNSFEKQIVEIKKLLNFEYIYLGFSKINPNIETLAQLSNVQNLHIQFIQTKDLFDSNDLKSKFSNSDISFSALDNTSVLVRITPKRI